MCERVGVPDGQDIVSVLCWWVPGTVEVREIGCEHTMEISQAS